MSSNQSLDSRTVKAKKAAAAPSLANQGHSGPTTFFLKTEKEMERNVQQRGRKTSRSSVVREDTTQKTPMASLMGDGSFGVQSLEDAIRSTSSSDRSLSRTTSNSTDTTSDAGLEGSVTLGRKRKAGNRVHPTILATGQRIISAERVLTQASSGASPSSAGSPLRHPHRRRGSATSSINMSQPQTPIRLSPHPESATPSTPRSGSPKSFRLSDEEGSVSDETNSQAVLSSIGNDDEVERTPQLVMPSLAMPARRPFTEQGRRMGRAKILVVGPKGVGKTSFIRSLYHSTDHIVHMDLALEGASLQLSLNTQSSDYRPTTLLTEIQASTRPYPTWWIDVDSRRTLRRRMSMGDGVLERNLTFIDTPGFEDDEQIQGVLDHVKLFLRRATTMESLSDSELVSLLSGDGGIQLDATIYLFDPELSRGSEPSSLSHMHQELLQCLSRWTNLIPVIGRADTVTPDTLSHRKQQIAHMLESLNVENYQLLEQDGGDQLAQPLAISSAVGDDKEVIDASLLMSSQYMPALVPSELGQLVDILLTPSNIARMRHISAMKFLRWRRENPEYLVDLQKQTLFQSPFLRPQSPGVTSTGSLLDEPSKVLVPHSSSSYYRSASPGVSEVSAPSENVVGASAFALARYNEQAQPSEPFRQVRLAKWAQDLRRSLDNERRKFREMYTNVPTEWSSESGEKHDHQALVSTKDSARPPRGHLGGDLGVIDPRDPLGVLAFGQTFRRRGFFALQIVGGCGLIGAVAYWVMKNWLEVQEFFGLGQPVSVVNAAAVPAPTRSVVSWLDDNNLRGFFGWDK